MKILLDFIPLLLFFVSYLGAKALGHAEQAIYVATAVLMVGTVLQMLTIYLMERQLQLMHKFTLGMILVFGGLTLVLHDKRFIMWKPTVLYIAIALVLASSEWLWKKNFLKTMLGSQIELPDPVWARLNLIWVAYCLFCAAINGYAALYFTEQGYVNFKLWGYIFPLLFIVGQGLYIAPHLKEADASAPDSDIQPKP